MVFSNGKLLNVVFVVSSSMYVVVVCMMKNGMFLLLNVVEVICVIRFGCGLL